MDDKLNKLFLNFHLFEIIQIVHRNYNIIFAQNPLIGK